MTVAAAIVHIIAAAGIVKAVIPAAIIAGPVIARTPVIVIIAAAIIAGADTHATIIAVVIGAAAKGQRANKADRSQELLPSPGHRLSPYPCILPIHNAACLNWL